jgi:hypothetical protein
MVETTGVQGARPVIVAIAIDCAANANSSWAGGALFD